MEVKNDFLNGIFSYVILKHLQVIVEISTRAFNRIIDWLGCRLSNDIPECGFEIR